MVPFIQVYLADRSIFICPGAGLTAPIIGVWFGIFEMQEFLNHYSATFARVGPAEELTRTTGPEMVTA